MLIAIGAITLVGVWLAVPLVWLLWSRAKHLDKRHAVLDRRVAAIGQVIIDLYPEQGPSESRAAKKAKALAVLRRIDERDLDTVRLAIHEVTRSPFESC